MFRYQAPNPHIETMSHVSLSQSTSSSDDSKKLLPSLARNKEDLSAERLEQLASERKLVVTKGLIETHDMASLDTLSIATEAELTKPINERYFVIKFNGNGRFYLDFIDQFTKEAASLDSTIIGFDYRGVNNSAKIPERFLDLVVDGIAQVQRLIDEGADPEKITLDGTSLGGAIATIVASIFHHQGKRVYLWNDRSFSTMSLVASERVKADMPGFLGPILSFIVKKVVNAKGWEADVIEAYKSIPETHKGYMVIAKESQHSDGDGILPHEVSLHIGIRAYEKQKGIQTGHKVLAHSVLFPNESCGHRTLRSQLVSKADSASTGQDIFENFVRSHKK